MAQEHFSILKHFAWVSRIYLLLSHTHTQHGTFLIQNVMRYEVPLPLIKVSVIIVVCLNKYEPTSSVLDAASKATIFYNRTHYIQ